MQFAIFSKEIHGLLDCEFFGFQKELILTLSKKLIWFETSIYFTFKNMGIRVEFNPDLALRNISEFEAGKRKIEECIPTNMQVGVIYPFLKSDQRNYWLHGNIPLIETKGNEVLSRPRASIVILEATHFLEDGVMYTKGFYRVDEIFTDDKIYFEWFDRVGSRTLV